MFGILIDVLFLFSNIYLKKALKTGNFNYFEIIYIFIKYGTADPAKSKVRNKINLGPNNHH